MPHPPGNTDTDAPHTVTFPHPLSISVSPSSDDADALLSPKAQEWRKLNFVSLDFGCGDGAISPTPAPLSPPLTDDEELELQSESDASSTSSRTGSSAPDSPMDADEPHTVTTTTVAAAAESHVRGALELDDVADRHREQPERARLTFERKLGETELSYFLPSRADGVNDMYLHLGLRAPSRLLTHRRILAAWALLRLTHTLLSASVHMEPLDYTSARFVYAPPRDVGEALEEAGEALSYRLVGKDAKEGGKEELIDGYLNGERTLSNERLSYLIVVGHTNTNTNSSTRNGNGRDERSPSLPTPARTPEAEKTQSESLNDSLNSSLNKENESLETENEKKEEKEEETCEFDILLCSTHFLGDGMALHTLANELFTLLGGGAPLKTAEEIEGMLEVEFARRWGGRRRSGGVSVEESGSESSVEEKDGEECLPPVLPPSLEQALPPVQGRFQKAAAKVDHQNSQRKLIGGHAFPRTKSPHPHHKQKRHTIVPTIPFTPSQTQVILKKCKSHGVSIANAVFALSALAWARIHPQDAHLPVMMYTALNIRPVLRLRREEGDWDGYGRGAGAGAGTGASYYFTAIGYLNVVLPVFLPKSAYEKEKEGKEEKEEKKEKGEGELEKTFWHRARTAKRQITQQAKHPLLVGRTHVMAEERGARARAWAREDDEKEAEEEKEKEKEAEAHSGVRVCTPPPSPPQTISTPPSPPSSQTASKSSTSSVSASGEAEEKKEEKKPAAAATLPRAPSTALVGLSMLGNLDSMYAHATYPSLALHTLTTGSRQRAGAALLFGYTFGGRLWLSLGYDEYGFERVGGDGKDVVGRWWEEVLRGVEEMFGCGPPPPASSSMASC